MTRFNDCISTILKWEGGFVDHPKDPGGATNMGITYSTLADWRRPRAITVEDVRNLTEEEAKRIYEFRYWRAIWGDELPNGVNLMVLNAAVLSGPRQSLKHLQRVVGADDDGIMGSMTMGATWRAYREGPEKLIYGLREERAEFLSRLRHFKTFGRGWLRRLDAITDISQELAR